MTHEFFGLLFLQQLSAPGFRQRAAGIAPASWVFSWGHGIWLRTFCLL